MEIKIATEEEIKDCYKVLHQIRDDLSEVDFLNTITKQIKNGYKVAYVIENNQVICVAKLSWGKYIYIEDFVTEKGTKSCDAAKALWDFIRISALQQECDSIHLDSLVQRHEAHKFYLNQDMKIDSHHFSLNLK